MTTLLPTQPQSATEQAPLLQATLVDLIDLSITAKQAHWNVVGPTFRPLHEYLDEITDEYRDWYDGVAERMAAVGVSPDGRVGSVAATTTYAALPAGQLSDQTVLEEFDGRVTELAARLRQRLDALGDADLASQDLLIEILRGVEKQRWMIRAHLGR